MVQATAWAGKSSSTPSSYRTYVLTLCGMAGAQTASRSATQNPRGGIIIK